MIARILSIFFIVIFLVTIPPVDAQECSAQDVEAWKIQANNDYELDNYEAAIDGYTCMIDISDEEDAYAYLWRGVSYRLLGELDQALADINQAITLEPTWGYAYYSRGNWYVDADDYEAAVEDYSTAIANGYVSYGLYINRGYSYNQLRDTERAKQDYLSAIANNPESGLGYSNLGSILFTEGDLDGALENFELAIDNSNGRQRAFPYRNRGDIHFMNQDYRLAVDDYTTALEIAPDAEDIYLLRAEVYRALGSPNAYADYLRYIQLIQTEIVDLDQTVLNETLEMGEGACISANI